MLFKQTVMLNFDLTILMTPREAFFIWKHCIFLCLVFRMCNVKCYVNHSLSSDIGIQHTALSTFLGELTISIEEIRN